MECSGLKVWVMLYDTDNKYMMLWDSRYHEIFPELWGTECNAETIVDSDNWIMDGTFKSAPNLFTQLFTINGLFPDGYRIPPSMVIGMLPGKTTTLYKNLFEEIDSWGPYLLDYELAIHNAVAEVCPSTTRRGCNFHFKQCSPC